ncbi:transglutaminase domain protein [Catenulispora acidiphila DSM 44928]|uniref:Transglutaminase domain protein n=1 Tax=Catenulispora acidiphila (strain DSM 44928 / JCM 14897 / NBRC 102108 / NRRL B-24433 / ID139908) TaxID=479433 RepID=C7QDD9_CATAD|nr:transglutaminase-like domain-containing protein [Catenulispora acidiphila]ACU72732.1 transglutaminase domain protein [Catenulispora acidiphila DSM 44928]
MEAPGTRLSRATPPLAADPRGAPAPSPSNRGPLAALLCIAGAALTAVPYGSFFASGNAVIRLAEGAIAGGVIAWLCAVFLRRPLAIAAVGAAGLAVSAVYIVLGNTLTHGLPQTSTLRVGRQALVGGWAAMLSVGAPAGTTARLVMDPYAVTYTAAFTALILARRTRVALAPAAALMVAELVALFFAGVQPTTHLAQCAGLFVLVLVLSALRTHALRTGPMRIRAGNPAPIQAVAVLVVMVIATLGARALPMDGKRFDPSTLVRSALSLHPTVNPLAEVRAQLQRPQAEDLFSVRISGANGGERLSSRATNTGAAGDDGLGGGIDLIQCAALDSFSGSQWSSSAAYLVSGPDLAPGPVQPDATRLTEQISLTGLSGPFLPTIGRPSTITGSFGTDAVVGFDTVSGTLVTDAAKLSGVSYKVTSAVSPSSSALENAPVGTGSAYAPYLALPSVPPDLSALAATITSNYQGPYAKAVAIERYLRQLPYNVNAQPGESYAALERMLDAEDPQSAAAYGEQHVSAFAVLARSAGLPTRIAVGYALTGVNASQYTVTTADAYAWDQVYFQGHGWVDFDPTDPNRGFRLPDQQPLEVAVTVPTPSIPPPPTPITSVPSATPTPIVPPVAPRQHSAFPWRAVAGTGVGLLVCAAAAVPLIRASTRRRRRRARLSGGPSHRVAGAWLEICDRLGRAGVPIPPTQTVVEAARTAEAAAAREPLGRGRTARIRRRAAESLATLAPLTDRAVFAPHPVSESDAQDALTVEREFRSEFSRISGAARMIRRRDRAARGKKGQR